MSLVWTLIASFLYTEILIVLLLVLPVASPQRWQRFFKSRFLEMIGRQAHTYFFLLLGILVLFLLEAIREMRKYSHHEPAGDTHLNIEMQHSMRLFRAQRNFYISGFSIFLTLVIRRLVTLISAQATLLAQSEASMKQAQSATLAARSLLSEKKVVEKGKEADEDKSKTEVNITYHHIFLLIIILIIKNSNLFLENLYKYAYIHKYIHTSTNLLCCTEFMIHLFVFRFVFLSFLQIEELKQKIHELTSELNKERKDKEAMKSQSESLNKEYDRLTEEYSKLQRKIAISSDAAGVDKND